MSAKLNWLIRNTSPGTVVAQAWLTKNGVSPQLAQKYVKSGWLHKLGSGVYVRPGKPAQWFNAVACLLEQLDFPVHVAGLSSLAHQGKTHYILMKETMIWLEVPPRKALPKWFQAFPNTSREYQSTHTAREGQSRTTLKDSDTKQPDWLLVASNKLENDDPTDLLDMEISGTRLKASRVELAAYELLRAVPSKISFEHAAQIFQGLTTLSPRKVQSILNRSHSIKTNRLFLFLSHYYQLPFADRINESTINIGAGKRQIVTGGILDKKYQITVPNTFLVDNNLSQDF